MKSKDIYWALVMFITGIDRSANNINIGVTIIISPLRNRNLLDGLKLPVESKMYSVLLIGKLLLPIENVIFTENLVRFQIPRNII
jgi:hypothetical protein